MKAKYEPRIDLNNRTRLETVIPLDTPITIFVDPSDACNFKCKFVRHQIVVEICWSAMKQRFDLFKKIADDTAKFRHR